MKKYKIVISQIDKETNNNNCIELFAECYSQLLTTLATIKLAFDNDKYYNVLAVYAINDNIETSMSLQHINISF